MSGQRWRRSAPYPNALAYSPCTDTNIETTPSRCKASCAAEMTNWGTGTPRRKLLHMDALASAYRFLLQHYACPNHVNVGTGTDQTISEIADMVAAAASDTGETRWDPSKPDGTPRKSVRRVRSAGGGMAARTPASHRGNSGVVSRADEVRSH